jgi:Oxidoreductase family, NAD-binding Rossmann fold
VAESRPTRGRLHDRPVRWGIVGTGGIAAAFAADLRVEPAAAELVAVASRTPARAEAFAALVGAPRAYGTHEQLGAAVPERRTDTEPDSAAGEDFVDHVDDQSGRAAIGLRHPGGEAA